MEELFSTVQYVPFMD